MAADIQKQFEVVPELIVGAKGIFDVAVNGEVIFSKHEQDRFPEHAEVLEKIGELAA